VEFDNDGNALLVVEPTLIADVDKETPKVERIRGLLGDVNEDMGYFYVNLCPFTHNLKEKKHRFGDVMVLSGTETVYDINGEGFVGDDGLSALADVDKDTPVLVKGSMKFDPRRFEATEVYVGTSVPTISGDVIMGSVIARDGNTLKVNGMVCAKDGSTIRLNDTAIVTLSDETVVKKEKSTDTYSIGDIAPGQRVWITGDLTISDSNTPYIDATQGTARLLVTTLRGHVAPATVDSDLNLELGTIDFRKPDLFDFTGTGDTAEHDADPDSYEIETGSLSTAAFETGDPIKVYGFVNAFGAAPYDFEATTLVNYVTLPSVFTVKWSPSSTDPFESITDEGIVVDLSGKNVHHLLCKAQVNENDGEDLVTLVPAESGVYVIKMRKGIYIYSDFTKFVEKMETFLDGANAVKRLFATGNYESDSKTLTTTYLTVEIK
jgi:hypothetical protein